MFGPHNDSHFINIMCSCRRCGVVPDRQHLVCVCVYAYISKQCVCVLVCVLTLAIDRESDWSVNKFVDVIILYLFPSTSELSVPFLFTTEKNRKA